MSQLTDESVVEVLDRVTFDTGAHACFEVDPLEPMIGGTDE